MRRAILTCVVVATGLVASGCHSTFIDLNPDVGGDGGTANDAEPADGDAEVVEHAIILPPPPCGNGELDDGEECDDGNREDRDGCTWDCLLGDGDPVGPPDPSARSYVVEGPPLVLPAAERSPLAAMNETLTMSAAASSLVASWTVSEGPAVTASLTTRFLATDGSLAAPDVVVWMASGWSVRNLAGDVVDDRALLVWRVGAGGLFRTSSSERGLETPPTILVDSVSADLPGLAGLAGGHLLAWYEGTDSRACTHNGVGPSRIFLRRLGPDGATDGMPAAVAIEDPLGARTAPRLAAGADSSVGILWWRAGTEPGSACALRFGTTDAALATVADGGVLGAGPSGRIVDAEDAYRVVWRRAPDAAPPGLGFAAFDRGAMLLDAPVTCDLPFEAFWGDVEMAAGDHGLVTVFRGWDEGLEQRLFFVRTDLLGRTGDISCGAQEVDPSCTMALGCEPGPFGVAWAGDAFVVVYFVTLDPGSPSPTTEMRMVRLVAVP